MQNIIQNARLTVLQEANYLCSYIRQYVRNYSSRVNLQLHTSLAKCQHYMEHNLLLPLINDAFKNGIFTVADPVLVFDMQLNDNYLTFGLHYKINQHYRDENTGMVFIKLKQDLERLYPGRYILYKDYYANSYLVILQIKFA